MAPLTPQAPTGAQPRGWGPWALLFAALFAAASFRLGSRALWDPDEARNAEIASSMRSSGDWLTPRLDGAPYLEKPPLLYWVTAASFSLFRVEDGWSARLPQVLVSLLTVLLVAHWGRRRLGASAGFWAAAAYGSCLYVFLLSHAILTDALLTLGVVGTLVALDLGRAWLLALSLPVGLLAKGPVALVLPALAVSAECLLLRSLGPWKRVLTRRFAGALATALAVALPWFVLEARAFPSFPRFFLIHEHLERFATEEARRTQPWWMLAGVVAGGLCPWWAGFVEGLRSGLRDPDTGPVLRRCLAWGTSIVLFFSFSRSQLPSYVWPAFAPLALLVGFGLPRVGPRLWVANAVALAVMAATLVAASVPGWAEPIYGASAAAAPVGVGVGIAVTVLAITMLWIRSRWLLLAGALAVSPALGLGTERLDDVKSAGSLAAAVVRDDPSGRGRVVCHGPYRPSLAWALGRRVVLWGHLGELAFGASLLDPAEREAWFLDTRADEHDANRRMQELWASSERVYVVLRSRAAASRTTLPLSPPGRLVFEGEAGAVLANR